MRRRPRSVPPLRSPSFAGPPCVSSGGGSREAALCRLSPPLELPQLESVAPVVPLSPCSVWSGRGLRTSRRLSLAAGRPSQPPYGRPPCTRSAGFAAVAPCGRPAAALRRAPAALYCGASFVPLGSRHAAPPPGAEPLLSEGLLTRARCPLVRVTALSFRLPPALALACKRGYVASQCRGGGYCYHLLRISLRLSAPACRFLRVSLRT